MNTTQYAQQLFAEVRTRAEVHFGVRLPHIPLEFSSKLTKTGGYFRYSGPRSIKIVLSSTVMRLNDPKEFIDQVLPHEAAHFITHEVYGPNVQAHGKEWKSVMRMLGQKPTRCHSFKTKQGSTFTYTVNGRDIQVGVRRHNKIQSGYMGYSVRGLGRIDATMWEGATNPQTTVKPKRKVNTGRPTKANIVRKLINDYKAAGFTMPRAKANRTVIEEVMVIAGLSEQLAKRYITNLWDR